MMKLCTVLRLLIPLVTLLSLTACSSSGSSGTSLVAPTLLLVPKATKIFHFSWADISGETEYRLLEDPDSTSGYTQIATIAADSTSYDLVTSLPEHINARYILEACDSSGCDDSTPVSVSGTLSSAIGYFKASNTDIGDDFGSSVAISADGKTMAVGAPYEASSSAGINSTPNNSSSGVGAVYVFSRDSAGTWSQQAYLKAASPGSNDWFGNSVSLSADGNTLAVGADGESSSTSGVNTTPDDASVHSGAAYVFTRSGTTWSQQAYIKPSTTVAYDEFGNSVAISGDGNTLAVGEFLEDSSATGINGAHDTAASSSGAVYVFTLTNTIWSQQAYIKASNTGQNDEFGRSVALSTDGNTLAVGAWWEDGNGSGVNPGSNDSAADAGASYVFSRDAISSIWSQQAYIKASNTVAGAYFGESVALSGDGNTLAVGSERESSSTTGINSTPDTSALTAGAAYVYSRSGSTWATQAYIKASNTGADDIFGRALALSSDGNTLVVGAPQEDSTTSGINTTYDDAGTNDGAAYFYTRSGTTWSQQAYLKASNAGSSDYFGSAISLSSDGSSLAISSPYEGSSSTGINSTPNDASGSSGAVYLY